MAKTLVEATYPNENDEEVKELFHLEYWGSTYELIDLGEQGVQIAQYTVVFCSDLVTGQIHSFVPQFIRMLGKEDKK